MSDTISQQRADGSQGSGSQRSGSQRQSAEARLDVEPKRPDDSIGDLLSEAVREITDLFRKEVELAKVEARVEVREAAQGAAALIGAALAATLFLALGSVALAMLLDEAMHRAWAFTIVAAIWLLIAIVLAGVGRARLRRLRPLPETIETLKEDAQWAKTLTS